MSGQGAATEGRPYSTFRGSSGDKSPHSKEAHNSNCIYGSHLLSNMRSRLGPEKPGVLQFYYMRFKRITTSLIARREALLEYRKRNLVFWSLFLSGLPVIGFVAVPLGRRLNSESVAQIVATGWFMVIVA